MKALLRTLVLLIYLLSWESLAVELQLSRYLEVLNSQDIEVKRYLNQRMQERFHSDLSLPDRSWTLSVAKYYGLATDDSEDTEQLSAEISKKFSDTGTRVSVTFERNHLEDREEKVKSLEISQSLLQDAFGSQNRKLKSQLSAETVVKRLQSLESYEDYIAEKINVYLEFILAHENFITSEEVLQDAMVLEKEVKARKNMSIANSVDIDRATVELLEYRRAVLEAKAQLKSKRKSLFAVVDRPVVGQMDYVPQRNIPFVDEEIDFKNEKESFLQKSRTMEIHRAEAQANDLNVEIKENSLLPEADIVIGYNSDESDRFSTSVSREETVVGFNLSLSLDQSQKSAELKQARYLKAQSEMQLRSIQRRTWSTLLDLEERILDQRARVSLLEKQVSALERLSRGEQTRFKKGRVDLETLIEARTKYTAARYDLTAQRVALAREIVQWRNLVDRLVTASGVN